MLKFIGTLRNGSPRLGPKSSNWVLPNHQMISACSSTSVASQTKVVDTKPSVDKPVASRNIKKSTSGYQMINLLFDDKDDKSNKLNDKKFKPTNEAKDLLKVVDKDDIPHVTAVMIITTLHQMVDHGKLNKTDFENDWRYQKLCRILAKSTINHSSALINKTKLIDSTSIDLSEIDSSANIYNLTTSAAVKFMAGLAAKQKRVKPLLQSLAENIGQNTKSLSLKQVSDILYSMAILNFADEPLLLKLSDHLKNQIKTIRQSPIIGSIATSLGLMRYRNCDLMNELTMWIITNKDDVRTQDVCALLMTLATIGFKPANSDVLFKEMILSLKETDMIKSSMWLSVVWALTILEEVTPQQVESVLCKRFVSNLADPVNISLAKKVKLLNINAAAKLLIKDYTGPFLDNTAEVLDAQIIKSKEKQAFVMAITDALGNLLPSREYFERNVITDTGFLLDVEFYINNKSAPLLPADIIKEPTALRIAVVANSYHDHCIGENNVIGPVLLHYRLLKAKGYRIMDISHLDFHPQDKLLQRITYLNDRIKSIVY